MTSAFDPANSRRHGFQFRITTLLVATAGVGLVCAGLTSPNIWWEAAICGAALLSIFFVALISVYRKGNTKAIALGYLIFCGGYLVYYDVPRPTQSAIWSGWGTARWSWTDSAPLALYQLMHGDPVPPTPSTGSIISPPRPSVFVFVAIFHHALASLLGVLGAIIAKLLYATQRRESTTNDS
jgi:hypothetical protein